MLTFLAQMNHRYSDICAHLRKRNLTKICAYKVNRVFDIIKNKMDILEIKKYPEPILRKVCNPVEELDEKKRSLLETMAQTMYYNQGIGLAAPQVGIDARLAVVDAHNGLVKLVNPKILKKEGKDIVEEGCLSIPDIYVRIKRAKKILVEFIGANGDITTLEAQDIFARAIQHEIDHLNGRLIIDYINPVRKLLFFLSKKYRCNVR